MVDIEIELYDETVLAQACEPGFGDLLSSDDLDHWDREPARQNILRAVRNHPLGNKRKLVVGTAEMAGRIAALELAAPHFGETLGLIRRASQLSMRANASLTIPPLLLVSEPGLGKTWLARRVAEAIGVPMAEYSFASGDDPGVLTGHSLSWRGARVGLVAKTLLMGESPNPVVFIDEVDKAMSLHGEDPTDCLHALLEPENARRYSDQFLELPIRADHVIWILTANTVEDLKPSQVDRTLVMRIERPTDDQQERVLQSIVDEALGSYRDSQLAISPEAFRRLLECSPRVANRIVELALGYAVADERLEVSAADIQSARRLAGGRYGRRPIGFGALIGAPSDR